MVLILSNVSSLFFYFCKLTCETLNTNKVSIVYFFCKDRKETLNTNKVSIVFFKIILGGNCEDFILLWFAIR